MEAHPVNHSIAVMPIWFMLMLLLGTLVAVGATWAARRKHTSGSIVGILAGSAVASIVLLSVFGAATFAKVRHVQVEQRRAELQHRLHAISSELHGANQRVGIETVLTERGTLPIEAPRPFAKAEAVAGSGGRRIAKASATPLPDWALTPVSTEDDRELVVVQSEQFADPATAIAEALQEATTLVLRHFEEFKDLPHNSWSLDPQLVRSAAVRRTFTESINRSAGEHDFTVYRTYMLVELSPSVRDRIEPIWREQVSQGRSLTVMVLLGMVTAFVGVIAGYFRLDDRTAGRHRWALGLGALASTLLILAGAGLAGTTTSRMSLPVAPRPPLEIRHDTELAPPRPPGVDAEPSVDYRRQERFQAAADRMVSAINAADYEGLREDFDKVMLDKFSVEECNSFFRTRISDKYGKIERLEMPEYRSDRVAQFVARCERGSLDFTLVLDDDDQVAGMLFKPRPEVSAPAKASNRTDCSDVFGRG